MLDPRLVAARLAILAVCAGGAALSLCSRAVFSRSAMVATADRGEDARGQVSQSVAATASAAAPNGSRLLHYQQLDALAQRPPQDVPVLRSALFPLSESDLEFCRTAIEIPSDSDCPAGAIYHLLRLHGPQAELPHTKYASTAALLELLLNDEPALKAWGRPAASATRYGYRFPTLGSNRDEASVSAQKAFEGHRDQGLATLAEIGVPLNQSLIVGGQRATLLEVLRDSMANFDLRQKEIDWTAIAYTLYLPPATAWTNRFEETTTFDDLALEMLHRKSEKASCYGIHLFYGLTLMLRVDERLPLLSAGVRQAIVERLQTVVTALVETQGPAGGWGGDWDNSLRDSPRTGSDPRLNTPEVLATGHALEWMLYLPEELAPPSGVLLQAQMFLLTQLKEATPADRWQRICPFSHAAIAVRTLARSDSDYRLLDRADWDR